MVDESEFESEIILDEDPKVPMDVLLDKLCWEMAYNGMEHFPPEDVAEDRIEYWRDVAEEHDNIGFDESDEHRIRGETQERFDQAHEFFIDMVSHGYDPVGRANRDIERFAHHTGSDDVSDIEIDWAWWEELKPDWIDDWSSEEE